jgi:hypothetical protein
MKYASNQCGVKFVEMPKVGYKSAKTAPVQPSYVSTPDGYRLPLMSDGLPPITESPAGSFQTPMTLSSQSCTNFSPYNLAIGVL